MIHRFRVQNFKSIVDVDVDLSPVTVLVGKSGTGKSNFVHALRCLRDALLLHQIQESWPAVRPAGSPDGDTKFEVDFSVIGIGERFTYELGISPAGPREPPAVERLILGNKCLFEQITQNSESRWIIEPELLQVPPPGPLALGRLPSISEVVIAFTALASGIGCYAFTDHVLSGEERGQHGPPVGLDDGATNFLAAIKEIVSDLQDFTVRKSMVSALQRVNPSVSSVELDNLIRPSSVVVGHRFDGKTLSLGLSQESDGFRRFYAFLLALYQRPRKQTLLFEHPEDGIHPGALSLLAEEFKAAPEHGRGQVILTTHSPKLLDHFDAEQIRVVELDGFATRIGPVSTEQREAIRDNLLDAGELLTVDPARMEQETTVR